MALFDELFAASFKGAAFLVNRTKTSGGRKDVKHSFPNSDRQSIEDLGLMPRTYNITAIINEPNYINKRDILLAALEEGGSGVLSHPFYGRLDNIVARTWTTDENLTELGDMKIQIVFEVSDSDGLPIQALVNVNQVAQQSEIVSDNVADDIASIFQVTVSLIGNYESAQAKLNELIDAVIDNSRSLTATPDEINGFNKLTFAYQGNINSLITTPNTLGADTEKLFTELPKLYATADEQLAALSLFFDFAETDVLPNATTAGLTERNANTTILNTSVIAFALAEAYTAASGITFVTVADVDTAANLLEVAFQRVKQDGNLSSISMGNLEELRTLTQSLFDEQKLSARQILQIQTQRLPARVIEYSFYGTDRSGANLAQLNDEINVSFLAGDIDILTV